MALCPSISTRPPILRRIPVIASTSSRWPLPSTPATPKISPARTSTEKPLTVRTPRSSSTSRPRTLSTTSPGAASPLSTWKTTSRPTIRLASDCWVAVCGSAVPATRPLRSTVMRSATASTSRSLWVMNTIDLPWSTRLRTTPKNSSTSPGVSTAVGSSRIRMSASRNSAFTSSTRCCSPTERSPTFASGSTIEPVLLLELTDAAPGFGDVEQSVLGELVAEDHVLGNGEHRDQLEVLVHHADARGRSHRSRLTAALARREPRSPPGRAGTDRRRRSSACSCRLRSRRAGNGSRPGGASDRHPRWRSRRERSW